jgi:dihydroxy-acid dehydratase
MEARGGAAWKPQNRARKVTAAPQANAAVTTSADTGAVRDVSQLGKWSVLSNKQRALSKTEQARPAPT